MDCRARGVERGEVPELGKRSGLSGGIRVGHGEAKYARRAHHAQRDLADVHVRHAAYHGPHPSPSPQITPRTAPRKTTGPSTSAATVLTASGRRKSSA